MKKYISVMLVMLLALSLAACGTDESSVTEPPEQTGENPAVQTGQESPEQAEKEAANLNSGAYLQRISTGIYNGINAFVTHFERSRGFISKND